VAQRTEKVAESVAREIVQDIRRNNLGAGSTLPPESAMLERFGVGRGSLREALRILEINGLVVLKPGPRGGPVVAAFDPAHFGQMMTLHLQALGTSYRQLLDSRVEYEAVLARMAAEREGDDAAAIMQAAMAGDLTGVHDDSLYSAATGGFHSAVGLASGNNVLALAADAIYAIWSVRVTRVLYPPDRRDDVLRDHRAIAKAIQKREPKRAERLMREHMVRYKEYCEERYPARMDDLVDWS
jgi:GntR family transcriptional repressor for pyruvate dehydrogenase complex